MKVLFNCLQSGLANNGGSRTLLFCQKTIRELGHKCDIAAANDRFTWFDHPKPIRKINGDYDVIVATACTTVAKTLYASNIRKKAWYIRGHEIWVPNYDENTLIEMYCNKNIVKITNSRWIQKFIERLNVECHLVPQGIDTELWYNTGARTYTGKIISGCLYSKKPSKGWDHFKVLSDLLGHKYYSYIAYGSKDIDNPKFLDTYFSNPSIEALRDIYSSCHYWFSPTELEGLHNPTMEAALCGAKIVCSNHPRNGITTEYANKYNAFVYDDSNVSLAADLIKNDTVEDTRKVDIMKTDILNKIGNRKDCVRKLIKVLGTI